MAAKLHLPKSMTIALVALVLGLFPAQALGVSSGFFGVDQGVGTPDLPDFAAMKTAKVGALRFTLGWRWLQPAQAGPIDWRTVDHIVGGAASQGIDAQPVVGTVPQWISKDNPWHPPLDTSGQRTAWKNFIGQLVKRYKPDGEYWKKPEHGPSLYQRQFGPLAKPRPIKAYQIWNEPNLGKYFPQDNAPKQYAKLVKLAHSAIKGNDRHAKVVLAGMPKTKKSPAWSFLKQLYHVKGFRRSFDVVALHPYPESVHDLKVRIIKMRKVMKRAHDARTKLWITELGWGSAHPSHRWPINKGLKGQRRMLKSSFKLILKKRRSWHIGRVDWYNWRDPAPGTGGLCSFCSSSGLLYHNRAPKPSMSAWIHLTGGKLP